jgi:methionyl-tRNA synthetase
MADSTTPQTGSGTFYITTPIYYVNDRPHIGHCYTTLLADAVAQFQRMLRGTGKDVFFLTGTDEHADKVVTSAAEHGKTTEEWARLNAEQFKSAFEYMGFTNDDFIRTTEARHKEKVVQYIGALLKSGDIYKGEYTGWYDPGQEEYVTETAAREHDYKSAISGKPLVKRTEPCYFFRLGKYQERLQGLIESGTFRVAPEARKSEVLGRLRPPTVLNDVPISRPVTDDPATQWGIRIPGDPANRIYVWIDALFNYLTVVDTPARRRFWPAQVHLIGKDILWFHAVIWPALLIALKSCGPEYAWVELPKCVFGHGWWVSEGQKMSKSLGNFIDLEKLKAYADKFGMDALRWYLLTQGPLSGTDADFSHAKFVEVYNADLANGIGNCASRVANMIGKYFDGRAPEHGGKFVFSAAELELVRPPNVPLGVWAQHGFDWPRKAAEALQKCAASMGEFDIAQALFAAKMLAAEVDAFINVTAPFKIAKRLESDPSVRQSLGAILYCCAEAVRVASVLLAPAMPAKMGELQRRWNCAPPPGVPLAELARFAHPEYGLRPGSKLEIGEALFMRADVNDTAPG